MTHPAYNPIEPWQLTAYALDELDASDTLNVERALEADPLLRTELEQIQLTLTSVQSALANSSCNVKLDEKQTAVIASHIEQSVAPKLAAETATPSKLKLAERPFYRRKRFAALLATAAAIPLAATWGPILLDGRSPFAYTATDDVKNSSAKEGSETTRMDSRHESIRNESSVAISEPLSTTPLVASSTQASSVDDSEASKTPEDRAAIVASPDSVRADSGLVGDVDISFVPEMGLVIIKGNERDVEQVRGVIDQVKETMANEPIVRIADSSESMVADEEGRNKTNLDTLSLESLADSKAAPAEAATSLAFPKSQEWQSLSKRSRDKQAGAKQAGDKQMGEMEPAAQAGPSAGGMGGGYGGGESGGYRGVAGAGGMGLGGIGPGGEIGGTADGYGATSGGASGGAGGGRPAGPVTAPFRSAVPGNTRFLVETDAFHDQRAREFDQMPGLPEELRANVRRFSPKVQDNIGTDRFEKIVETPFVDAQKAPLSTFSIDVDTASYSKIRQTLIEGNRLPSPSMVRIEEMVNYFEYEYAGPQDGRPFASHMIVDRCPWNPEHQLVRVGLQAKKIDREARGKANIVFLIDVSGSMNAPNRLPLVKKSLAMMVNQLTENDRVAIVVYAGAAGCVLPSTCGIDKQRILSALDHLEAGGSTNGGQGIQLAYSIAKEHFVPGGANRVVLCTDGDFNVGVTGDDALVAMMQENAKSNIFLTCLGFGAGNYNDTMMEKISNKGNGVYGMIDNELEGRRMMVEQLGGTLVTVAKDVKIQVDFNSAKIAGYRLIGYEDRRLANRDFSDDKKDAGEIGAGHRVTALYEVVPAGRWVGVKNPSEGEVSKYAKKPEPKIDLPTAGENMSELLTLRVRYKEPEGSESTLQEFVLKETDGNDRPQADRDMRWATAVAEFGLLLRRSEMAPNANWSDTLERATNAAGGDPYRLECLTMMRKAMAMMR